MNIYHQLANEPWVISEPAFNNMLALEAQSNAATQISLSPQGLDPTPLTQVQDDIAIICELPMSI